ncbi:MAG: xanthine dehydrogenase family protein subunit M [Variovorax sp.]
MYGVEYRRASSVAEALQLLESNPDAKLLAGGQSLIAAMKLRLSAPSMLVDLGALKELGAIAVSDTSVTLGAMVRHAQVAESSEICTAIPALSSLAKGVGDHMVRNMGTIGGSVANNDPAADYPSALLALDALVKTTKRAIAAEDFFLGMYETALEPGEIIVSIRLRNPARARYMKFKNPASRFAMVGVFIADFGDESRVAVTGAASSVFRVAEMEAALSRNFDAASLDGISISPNDLASDLHSQADYRAHLIEVLARRAVIDMTEAAASA